MRRKRGLRRDGAPGRGLRRVYMMLFEDSVDEQLFLAKLEREKRAFETLIDEKSHFVIAPLVSRAGASAEGGGASGGASSGARSRGSGALNETWSGTSGPAQREVIVDMREFRSALPSMLNLAEYKLHVETLVVGDYILSPSICVERKAKADLVESLKSGRLFEQVSPSRLPLLHRYDII